MSFEETDCGDLESSEKAESIVTVDVVLILDRVFTSADGGGRFGGVDECNSMVSIAWSRFLGFNRIQLERPGMVVDQ